MDNIEIEVIESCKESRQINVNDENFRSIKDKKKFILDFLTDIIDSSNDDLLEDILTTFIYDHPMLKEDLSESTFEQCDQCRGYNSYAKFIIKK